MREELYHRIPENWKALESPAGLDSAQLPVALPFDEEPLTHEPAQANGVLAIIATGLIRFFLWIDSLLAAAERHLGLGVARKLVIQTKAGGTMPLQLTDGGAGSASSAKPAELDAANNPVTIDPTKITWGVSDSTAITLTPNSDGSVEIASAGKLGSFQLTCTDSGNGLSAQDTITVVAGAATSLAINFGAVV